jgi:hypothetical protein
MFDSVHETMLDSRTVPFSVAQKEETTQAVMTVPTSFFNTSWRPPCKQWRPANNGVRHANNGVWHANNGVRHANNGVRQTMASSMQTTASGKQWRPACKQCKLPEKMLTRPNFHAIQCRKTRCQGIALSNSAKGHAPAGYN